MQRILAAATALLVVLLAGCATTEGWDATRPPPAPIGTAAPGFVPSITPAPESTLSPRPGSWEGVRAPGGYRVALLTVGDDAPTQTLVDAVQAWGAEVGADVRVVRGETGMIDASVRAMSWHPDLIISAGDALVDPLSTVTASHLDVSFLIVGAELAEPTGNVTAVDWTGAAYRGEGLGTASAYDPTTFTPERAGRAVRAGVAAVLTGVTGVVLWID